MLNIKQKFQIASLISFLCATSLFITYNKHLAMWSIGPVWLYSLIAFGVGVAGFALLCAWLETKPSNIIIGICAAGFVFCWFAGVYFTEPDNKARLAYTNQEVGYNQQYKSSRNYSKYEWLSELSLPESSGDSDSGEGIIVIACVIIIILLIVGSCIIPHFWIISLFMISGMLYASYLIHE